jgi:molybdate transport system ATP-binding protein
VSGLALRFRLAYPGFALELDLALPGSGVTALFGPSGCGKTSCLRVVAGLARAEAAHIAVNGETWQDDASGVFLPTHRRALGYVFQDARLFAHLDVRANLKFGQKRVPVAQRRIALEQAVELLGIGHLMARRPQALSGGERQRVAIAQALATSPRLLLLDEPLAALDQARRQDILPWLERLRGELQMPMLYVTHSPDEVARLADTLVVLDQGRVTAVGQVAETLSRTDLPGMSGDDAGALLEGTVEERDARWHLARVAFAGGALWLRDGGVDVGRRVRLRILARDVSVATQQPNATSIQNVLPCTVDAVTADSHPSQVMVRLACGDAFLLARITARAADALSLVPGMRVWAQVKSVALVK